MNLPLVINCNKIIHFDKLIHPIFMFFTKKLSLYCSVLLLYWKVSVFIIAGFDKQHINPNWQVRSLKITYWPNTHVRIRSFLLLSRDIWQQCGIYIMDFRYLNVVLYTKTHIDACRCRYISIESVINKRKMWLYCFFIRYTHHYVHISVVECIHL